MNDQNKIEFRKELDRRLKWVSFGSREVIKDSYLGHQNGRPVFRNLCPLHKSELIHFGFEPLDENEIRKAS